MKRDSVITIKNSITVGDYLSDECVMTNKCKTCGHQDWEHYYSSMGRAFCNQCQCKRFES